MTVEEVLATRKQIKVLDSYMSYLDTGSDKQVVIFLHGNPTSSYLWRNVIPEVAPVARCVAPDLIGSGNSGKNPANNYRMVDHFKYLSAWIDAMKFQGKVHLVALDWGSTLGFQWANHHRDRVASITFMECPAAPLPSFEFWPEELGTFFRALRSPAGEDMLVKNDAFVEQFLSRGIIRKLTTEELDVYRKPFLTAESRKRILQFVRQVPILNDGPEENVAIATSYNKWLKKSKDLPKLYIHADPGNLSLFMKKEVASWPNLRMVTVSGIHFVPEDSPTEIGKAVREFLKKL